MKTKQQFLYCVLVCALATGLVSGFANDLAAQEVGERAEFGEPEMLYVGAVPLNLKAEQMYPSPAMFDIDGDGRDELVVGDIFGSLNIYENEAKTGDPKWSEFRALKSVDGEAIKVSNW